MELDSVPDMLDTTLSAYEMWELLEKIKPALHASAMRASDLIQAEQRILNCLQGTDEILPRGQQIAHTFGLPENDVNTVLAHQVGILTILNKILQINEFGNSQALLEKFLSLDVGLTIKDSDVLRKLVLEDGFNLRYAQLALANLSGIDFSRTDLQGADLRFCKLIKTGLVNCNLTAANMRGCNACFADFSNTVLTHAQMPGATFMDARFISANLTDANFHGCHLDRANFTGANISGTDLGSCRMDGSNLTDVTHSEVPRLKSVLGFDSAQVSTQLRIEMRLQNRVLRI